MYLPGAIAFPASLPFPHLSPPSSMSAFYGISLHLHLPLSLHYVYHLLSDPAPVFVDVKKSFGPHYGGGRTAVKVNRSSSGVVEAVLRAFFAPWLIN